MIDRVWLEVGVIGGSFLGNLRGCIIESLDCELLSFGNILEPNNCDIIEEPESSTG